MPCCHQPMAWGISFGHNRLLLEEHGKGFRHGNECDTAADGHHDSLLHVLVAVLHFEIHVEGSDEDDDGSNGLHQIRYRGLIRRNFSCGLGEASCALAAGVGSDGTKEEHANKGGHALLGEILQALLKGVLNRINYL